MDDKKGLLEALSQLVQKNKAKVAGLSLAVLLSIAAAANAEEILNKGIEIKAGIEYHSLVKDLREICNVYGCTPEQANEHVQQSVSTGQGREVFFFFESPGRSAEQSHTEPVIWHDGRPSGHFLPSNLSRADIPAAKAAVRENEGVELNTIETWSDSAERREKRLGAKEIHIRNHENAKKGEEPIKHLYNPEHSRDK